MNSSVKETSYLNWEPALEPAAVFEQTVLLAQVSVDEKGRLFWIEVRPEEGGRSVLVMRDLNGTIRDLTPAPFSARNRVFEYGSMPYTVFDGVVYFTNMADQRVYKVKLADQTAAPTAITVAKTASGRTGKYAELAVSPDGRWLAFAYESENPPNVAINSIGVIDLTSNELQEARILAEGSSFYKSPKFSPDGKSLAWLSWNHPFMVWDSTRLTMANFKDGTVADPRVIAGSDSQSITNIGFLNNGGLVFAMDFAERTENSPENFYNLYVHKNGRVSPLTRELTDFQQFRTDGESIYAFAIHQGQDRVLKVTPGQPPQQIHVDAVAFSVPVPFDDKFYQVSVQSDGPSRLTERSMKGTPTTIRLSSKFKPNPDDVSPARAISYPTEDGATAYGYYYPPRNSKYRAPEGELPPVRVLVHGGPTAMTEPGFSKANQFWTSQGYAIFDVNYRGSFGFGRRYRDELLKNWGILDIQDVKDGLKYLRQNNLISGKAVISGGSAGGYTVQRALTVHPELFSAGASHFGIGNLVTLQKLTHKYESHYLQQLIGGTLKTNLKEYEARSPINHLDKLKSPMIIFQGSDDKVVPPENSREMAAILKKKGIVSEYHEYAGEDHGFRKKENLVDSLTREATFFKAILR